MESTVYIIDTSAILSGKHLPTESSVLITTPGVDGELQPGGKDYRRYSLLKEQGLEIRSPTSNALQKVKQTASSTGDNQRVSSTDLEVLALAYDFLQSGKKIILLTDDYSMQNLADTLQIPFLSIAQQGITKRFKWHCRCPGCKRDFHKPVDICPICGTATRMVHDRSHQGKKKQ